MEGPGPSKVTQKTTCWTLDGFEAKKKKEEIIDPLIFLSHQSTWAKESSEKIVTIPIQVKNGITFLVIINFVSYDARLLLCFLGSTVENITMLSFWDLDRNKLFLRSWCLLIPYNFTTLLHFCLFDIGPLPISWSPEQRPECSNSNYSLISWDISAGLIGFKWTPKFPLVTLNKMHGFLIKIRCDPTWKVCCCF